MRGRRAMAKPFSTSVSVQHVAGLEVAVVGLCGYVDAHTFGQLERQLHEVLDQGHYHLVLDFGEMEFINSSGLGLLLGVKRIATRHQGDLCIIRMPEAIYEVFDVLGFSQLISVYPSWEAAAKALGARAKKTTGPPATTKDATGEHRAAD